MDEFRATIEDQSYYELCALYCDYHEWLHGPNRPPWPQTRMDYEAKMETILDVLAAKRKETP